MNDEQDFERDIKNADNGSGVLEVIRLAPKRMTGAGLESEAGMGLRR